MENQKSIRVVHQLVAPDKRKVTKVKSSDEKVFLAQVSKTDPTRIMIEAPTEGSGTLTLWDDKDKTETYAVFVREPDVSISVGDKVELRMSKEQLILQVSTDGDDIARLRSHTPSSVMAEGLVVGLQAVLMKDDKGKEETVLVGVFPAKK